MLKNVEFKLNNKAVSTQVEGDRLLLWVLRTEFELTGTKFGCGESYCGACTVVIDGEAARSCKIPIEEVQGREVLTIEGLMQGEKLHPIQQAFVDHDALQCGFCTPGMIMNAYARFDKKSKLTRDEIIGAMDENLCRCGAHNRIINALESLT